MLASLVPMVAGFTPAARSSLLIVSPHRCFRRTAAVFMPEGPECTLHAERLNAACGGRKIVRAEILSGRYLGNGPIAGRASPPDRWAILQQALPLTIGTVLSKGKFIFWSFNDSRLTLWSTLGMTGAWSLTPSEHARIRLDLAEDAGALTWPLYYNDQRNFGTITVCDDEAELERKLGSLGPSWLAPGGLPIDDFLTIAQRQCATKRSAAVPLAKFLMDQGKTSGIGNYILSETLYLSRVHPFARCGDLDEVDWERVHAAACDVISRSYNSQRALADKQAEQAAAAAQAAQAAAGEAGGGARSLSATRGTTFTFELHVFRRSTTADGLRVRKDEGPHKRSVYWVPERQLRGRPDES